MSVFAVILASQLAVEPPKIFPPFGAIGQRVTFCFDPPDFPPYKPVDEVCISRSCVLERQDKLMKPTSYNMICTYSETTKEEHLELQKWYQQYNQHF